MISTFWVALLLIICTVHAAGLSKLPTTRVLDNHGLHLEYIPEEKFSRYSQITHLILSNCSTSYIHPRAFCGLPLLRMLDLSDNDIQHIDLETFQCTPNLKVLSLSNNVNLGPKSQGVFLRSDSISYLDIKNCGFESFSPTTFTALKKLKLVVASDNLACLPSRRSEWGVRTMQCGDKFIHSPSTEKYHRDLVTDPDNISYLKIQNFSSTVVPERFLDNKNFSHLQVLQMSGLNIIYVHSSAFCGLNSLRSLDLSSNDLQYLSPDTFHCIPYLENLTLSNNPRLGFGPHRTFLYSNSIRNLYISNCGFTSYAEEMLSSLKDLKYVDASGNTICSQIAENLMHIQSASCSSNATSEVLSNKYVSINFISEYFFSESKWEKVRRLDLSNRSISVIHPSAFCFLPFLLELDLSDNQIQYLDPMTFECNPFLENLYLANNMELQPEPNEVFLYSKSLIYIDIGNCNFSAFTDKMFSGMKDLIFINAVGNPTCSQTTLHLRDISNVPCTDVFDYEVNAYEIPRDSRIRTERDHAQSAAQVQEIFQETPSSRWIPQSGGGIMTMLIIAVSVVNVVLVSILMMAAIWYMRQKAVYKECGMKKPLLDTP
ncbi:insulin-like growth factor-binding protein complex acid labile subunit [Anabrus simplex]|uniref:insulin-like growth factor-binding protein complex acid labile subunit n=1 Tax=Anabrus simplex TaxID=316456 RepID=UPI0035A29BFA